MKFLCACLILIFVAVTLPPSLTRASLDANTVENLSGRWRVKFTLSGSGEKNLVFDSQAKGTGSFLLLDAGPDNKPATAPQPATWSQTTNDRVSLSSEVELPIGTCCRELGTLLLKGKFGSDNSISGKAIFITGTVDEESLIGFRALIGTFTATRMSNTP
jgi:hypothetical protein